jgi:ketosteroid isomerase-like protein
VNSSSQLPVPGSQLLEAEVESFILSGVAGADHAAATKSNELTFRDISELRLQGVLPMRTTRLAILFLVAVCGIAVAQAKRDTFAAQMQKIRETWVQEFNAGHGDKVAAFYAPEAVLMRWDGTVHGHDSILAEMQRSISGGAHDYVVHSLRTDHSGDLGYDTGAYNVTLRDRVIEGNYVIVVRKMKGRWLIVAHSSVPNPAERP